MITESMEQAYRLCHHDFLGLSTKQAVCFMGISQRRIQRLLKKMRRIAPQLFPILTPHEVEVRNAIESMGFTYEEIAQILGCGIGSIWQMVYRLRKKGVHLRRRPQTLRFEQYMEDRGLIQCKF